MKLRLLRAVVIAAVGVGTVATAAPAGAATPLASASAIVNQPPVNSLLTLCVTSRSLDPNGTCLSLPPVAPGGPATSSGTATLLTALGPDPDVVFGFDGQITIGGQTFHGSVSGTVNAACFGSCADTVPSFVLSGTSASGSFHATCTGALIIDGTDSLFFGPPMIGGGASELSCDGSANGGRAGHVTLVSVYRETGYGFGIKNIQYSGAFEGA